MIRGAGFTQPDPSPEVVFSITLTPNRHGRGMHFVHSLTTPRVVFGSGSLRELPREVVALSSERVLLVTGPHSTATSVAEGLLTRRLVGIFDEASEHVPADVAQRASAHAQELAADLVLAIGGGSAIGTAKAVALSDGLPVLAVPTTYAGSEMTPIWGITEGTVKKTGRDARVLPRTVLYDPELTHTMSPALTAASGLNALAHCVEALYAPDASPLVRLAAEEGVRSLAEALPGSVRELAPQARERALYGAWLAGLALGNATMGIHHKLCHVLGGLQRLPHGGLHSVLLPYVVAHNRDAAPGPITALARALGSDEPAGALWDLARRLGAPASLRELGYDQAHSGTVVESVLAKPPTNPRPVDAASLTELLELATAGDRPARSVVNA